MSCVIALTRHIVKHLNLQPKIVDGFCAILDSQVTDWLEQVFRNMLHFCPYMIESKKLFFFFQSWEEVMAPSMEMLNYIGPLRKHKHGALDDNPSFVVGTLDLNRFKRHFSSLVERVCRLSNSSGDNHETDKLSRDNVDDYGNSVVAGIQEEPEQVDETSDWIDQGNSSDIVPSVSVNIAL